MSDKNILVSAAKKDYKTFEREIITKVEDKMKSYLSGFSQYLEKNAFTKKED